MINSVMFVHGAWMTPACWAGWRARFEAEGFTTAAPAWPYLSESKASLPAGGPDGAFAHVGIADLVNHYARLIEGMPMPPVVIGHSFGGLITQLLLDRGLGRAGVAIAPGPPRGVIPGPKAVRANLAGLAGFRGWRRIQVMSEKAFARSFANTLSAEESKRAYHDDIVPAPGRIFYQAAFGKGTKVHFGNPKRPPLLITVGSEDRTAPPSMAQAIYRRQSKSPSHTDLREFPGSSHYIVTEPGWSDVADHVLGWLKGALSATS